MYSNFMIQAHIYFLDESVGGRHGFASGLGNYWPAIRVSDSYLTSTMIRCSTADKMETGNYYDVEIELPLWQSVEEYNGIVLKEHFTEGLQIHLYEGSRIVAMGVVKSTRYTEGKLRILDDSIGSKS